jgi:hypothetical protein
MIQEFTEREKKIFDLMYHGIRNVSLWMSVSMPIISSNAAGCIKTETGSLQSKQRATSMGFSPEMVETTS